MRQEYAAVPFLDGQHASEYLARLEQRLSPSLVLPLASLLAQSPDPDGALHLLDRYAQAAPPEILEELASNPSTLTYLVAIFSYSETLGETFLADPALALQFGRDRHFTRLKSIEDLMQDYARYSVTHPDLWLASQLARFKRRNLLRIALKDVLHLSTLGETTLELSTLADVILKNALAYCDQELEKRYGRPQFRDAAGRIARCGFSIVSRGYLGGNELNYSSDIDLLFFYAGDGQTAGGSESSSIIPNKEYFVRLAEAINRTITQATPHGEVYHIDLRERPEGEKGDLAISVKSALEYYDHRARNWELQTLIKARHSAGDPWVTREFLHGVDPYIYRSAGGVSTIESELEECQRTSAQRSSGREGALDVKFHSGGTRDVEFLVQCLQRVHGCADPWVRSGGTLLGLRKLNDKGLLSDSDFARLSSAYGFLRKVEHRIQLKAEQHAHRLPLGHALVNRLARRVGVEATTPGEAGAVLTGKLKETLSLVEEIYKRLIHNAPTSRTDGEFHLTPKIAWAPGPGLAHFAATLRLLDASSPDLARVVGGVPLDERASKDAASLLAALLRSTENSRAVREHPERLRIALQTIAFSPHFAQSMIQHPDDLPALDSLVSDGAAHSPNQLEIGLAERHPSGALSDQGIRGDVPAPMTGALVFPWATDMGLSFSQKMALLRTEYRAQSLRLSAGDCANLGPVFESLNRWTNLASRCVASAFNMAKVSRQNGTGAPLVVLGLGRLGIGEFDLASSAKLAFVMGGADNGEGLRTVRRVADKTIEALSSYTADGNVFLVDSSLMKSSGQAVSVISEDDLLRALADETVFEALPTFAVARPIVGDLEFGRKVVARVNKEISKRLNSNRNAQKELHKVIEPFANNAFGWHAGNPADLGEAELTISLLRLRHGLSLPSEPNIPGQITALLEAGYLGSDDAQTLLQGAGLLLAVDHAIRLVTGRAPGNPPESTAYREEIGALISRWGLIGEQNLLDEVLAATNAQIHTLCLRLLGSV